MTTTPNQREPNAAKRRGTLKRVRAPHFDPDVVPLYRALRWRRLSALDKRRCR